MVELNYIKKGELDISYKIQKENLEKRKFVSIIIDYLVKFENEEIGNEIKERIEKFVKNEFPFTIYEINFVNNDFGYNTDRFVEIIWKNNGYSYDRITTKYSCNGQILNGKYADLKSIALNKKYNLETIKKEEKELEENYKKAILMCESYNYDLKKLEMKKEIFDKILV